MKKMVTGVTEMIYDYRLYDQINTHDFDLPHYQKWCEKAGGRILELCCGTGRLTIPLKKAGIDIMGLDFTQSMLDGLAEKAEKGGVELEAVRGDIRDFELDEQFDLIFIPFNSLQHIYTIQDLESVLTQIKKHLKPGGYFLFDIFNPSIDFMVEGRGDYKETRRFQNSEGVEVIISDRCEYNAATQVNRAFWKYDIGGVESIEMLDMRCFYPLEIDAALYYNNFEIIHKYGWYDETPFASEHMKQIFVCQITSD